MSEEKRSISTSINKTKAELKAHPSTLQKTMSFDDAIKEALHSPATTTTSTPAQQVNKTYNSRLYWPDIINTPENKWTFSCVEIIDKLDKNEQRATEEKKNMEKCLIYFYTMKKKLNLFDHTYTAASILFYRFWYLYGLPASLINCIHVSQAILVTACKTMENNRPIDAYIKATCEYINQVIYGNRNAGNIDKLKWEVRDKLVNYEQRILTHFGFDINIENPKEIVEDIFSGFYRYNRDYDLPSDFKESLPKILVEVRSFIIQAVTQPVSLLCDGYSFLALAMLYCGIQYKKISNEDFKYPKDFFKERFPIRVTAEKFEAYFTDYRLLEQSFFDLKSNKGDKLQISKNDIESIIEESTDNEEPIGDPYSYDKIKSGEVQQDLLDHIEERVNEYINRITAGKKHSHSGDGVSSQNASTTTSPSRNQEPATKKMKI
ncbi:similar to Saccharomyces cerevisiae YLR226W BUR2 Cyclin for the Sgv1p (Bur1p) protein kinase [Maudiozyma saulgeensis]|uniref:Similar to Saccharomyces cerevisiae YLR226W BUR2 Cyclin for the Sgv1p (Bur1p) protein kinase n=1 Tax=Maudiozyma saulgeensis TaxID=1789683 RepID=A0A1X7RAV1_9SACH|nr:similar to Saccharomyces cerevisiae YLR226W BUR2 Cyclin for the Sgv1p (Bur1p) protein kinase [Kazachstania saulgeensis]